MNRETNLFASGKPVAGSLPDRLDSAIEETTTGLGALMTQMIRHSLYTGVHALEERLHEMAEHHVDTVLTEQMPRIERSAEEAAERVSRQKAAEVARHHVDELERRTEAAARALATQIETTDRRTREALASTDQKVLEHTETLAARIEETEQRARLVVESTAAELTGRIEETGAQAQSAVTAVRSDLSGQLVEVEHRVQDAAADLITREIEQLRRRARGTASNLRKRLSGLEAWTHTFGSHLEEEKKTRQREMHQASTTVQQQLQDLSARLSHAEQQARNSLEGARKAFAQEITRLREENLVLRERLAELEKPRGIKAMWQRLFGTRPSSGGEGSA